MRKRDVLLLILVPVLSLNRFARTSPVPIQYPVVSIIDYQAVPDDERDDRIAIQRAIDDLAPTGGTILFPKGKYLLSQSPGKSWCIRLSSNVSLAGAGNGSILEFRNPGATDKYIRMLATAIQQDTVYTNIHIRGLDLDGQRDRDGHEGAGEQWHAVFLAQCKDCSVSHCKLHGFEGDGIYAWQSESILVEDNDIFDMSRVGVNFAGADNSTARRNYIHDTIGNSFKMELNSTPPSSSFQPVSFRTGNVFEFNITCNAGGLSISSANQVKARDITIQNNLFDSCRISEGVISLTEVSDIEIKNNTIIKSTTPGIIVRNCRNIRIEENSILYCHSGSEWYGAISMKTKAPERHNEHIMIRNNKILFNAMIGIWLEGTERSEISGNIVSCNIKNPIYGTNKAITAIQVRDGSRVNKLFSNRIEYNEGIGISLYKDGGENSFYANVIRNNLIGILIDPSAGQGNRFGHSEASLGNCIFGNKDYGLNNLSNQAVDARLNYWGCPFGPGGRRGCDRLAGNVLFQPFSSTCTQKIND